MRAEPAIQKRLLELAEVDTELTRIAHRRRSLPEVAQLVTAEAAVQTARDAVVSADTEAGDLDRDIRRIERDVEGVQARTKRDEDLLAGGRVTPKQTTDLTHELETLARRRSVLEDEQLEIMEQREALQGNIDHSRVELARAEALVGELTEKRDTSLADIDAAEAGRRRARDQITPAIPADLLESYEKRRAQQGVGAALLLQRRCQSCRLELDRTALSELRALAPDEVARCPECGVLLVRTSESGL